MPVWLLCFLVSSLVCPVLEAQKKDWELGALFGSGFNVRHSQRLNLPIQTYRPWGFDAFLERRAWQSQHRQASWGFDLRYHYFGQNEYLGWALGFTPYASFRFGMRPKTYFYVKLGLGFGWLNRPFHPNDNPQNVAIGSRLNNNTSLALGYDWQFLPQWALRSQLSFGHFSNAASQQPNLGLNTVLLQLGLHRHIGQNPSSENQTYPPLANPRPKHQWALSGGLGFRERATHYGPKYLIYYLSPEWRYAHHRAYALSLGAEWEYNASARAFLNNIGNYTEARALSQAQQVSLKIGESLYLGSWRLDLQTGFYLAYRELQPWFSYFRINALYQVDLPKNHQLVFGLTVKTHLITAEYAAFVLAWQWGKT